MSTTHCRIDKNKIEKAIKEQRFMKTRLFLADTDCKGLRLAINSKSASWTYAYRRRGFDFGGKRYPMRTLKLGDLSSMTPQEAREGADRVKAAVRKGDDPAPELRQKRRHSQNASDADRPLSWWLNRYSTELGNETQHKRDEAGHIRLGLSEISMLEQQARSLDSEHLKALVRINKHRPATSRHRFGAISRFLDFLNENQIIDGNPALKVSKKHRPKPAAPRSMFYDIKELKKLWHPREPIKDVYIKYLRFMITTPFRAKEAAELKSDQINLSRSEIFLSANQTKNDEGFVMPLSRLAKQQFTIDAELKGHRLFELSSRQNQPMKSWSHFNHTIRRATEVEDFNLHNLRRTFSTLIAEHSDFGEGLIDSLLNHKQSATRSGVMRHYQHAKNLKRRREVMDWWNSFLIREVI